MVRSSSHPPVVEQPSRLDGRFVLVALFALYVALLVWVVLWKLGMPQVGGDLRVVKLVPFLPTAGAGASTPFELAVNVLLFVPFGLYVGLLAPSWRWWRAAGAVAAASAVLEVVQYVLALGRTDVSDLVLNVAGGLVGFGLLAVLRRGLGERTVPLVTRACLAGSALTLVLVGAFLASPVRLSGPPPGDLPIVPASPRSGR